MRRLVGTALGVLAAASAAAAVIQAHRDLALFHIGPAGELSWNLRVVGPALGALAALALLGLLQLGRVLEFARSHRAGTAVNAVLMVTAASAVLIFTNLISARRYARLDCTSSGLHTLDPRTVKVLEQLPVRVTAYVFVPPGHRWYPALRAVLQSYAAHGGERFQVRWLHPGLDLGELERTLGRLGIDPRTLTDPDVVILAAPPQAAGALPRTRHVTVAAMERGAARPAGSGAAAGEQGRGRGLRAEEALTRALLAITRPRQPRVLLLQGHRELELVAADEARRLQALQRALENLDFAVEPWSFPPPAAGAGTGTGPALAVPPDCDVLVIAGLESELTPPELQALERWLAGGGRLLVLAEPALRQRPGTRELRFVRTGLERLLAPYGVQLGEAVVYDGATVTPLGRLSFRVRIEEPLGAAHPITRPLVGQTLLLEQARPVLWNEPAAPPGEGFQVQPLLATQPSAIAVTDLGAFHASANPYDAPHQPGPHLLAVAVRCGIRERTGTAAAGPAAAPPPAAETRLVVVGDASWVSDRLVALVPANLDLAVNAVSWLAEREETISIAPRPSQVIRLQLDERDRLRLWLLCLVDLPGACIIAALLVWRARRR
ncbi:MAG: hypothetical protein KatS3mg102_2763 [Planctomycetota bacterium]|nr:MAG: hypothetical protein KatS3mg102_2763 [Planctomycetota bacterium]